MLVEELLLCVAELEGTAPELCASATCCPADLTMSAGGNAFGSDASVFAIEVWKSLNAVSKPVVGII